MYNLSAGELPDVFLHMFRRNSVVHNYPTRQRDAFHLPRTRTIFDFFFFFFFTGPRYWNELPSEISVMLVWSRHFDPFSIF